MRIKIKLSIGEESVKEDVIEIDDYKLEELDEVEIESAIEVMVRDWANQHLTISWEAEEV